MRNPWFIMTFALVLLTNLNAQNVSISSVSSSGDTPFRKKQEIKVDLLNLQMISNPYDYDEITVQADFTSPSNQKYTIDGFYQEEYQLDKSSGNVFPTGKKDFRIRFAPNEVGTWTYKVKVTHKAQTLEDSPKQFECKTANDKRGFVQMSKTNYLQFENGEDYIPIGENMAWHSGNPYTSYNTWLTKLSENKGNFIRLWQPSWGFGIEWRSGNGYLGLRKYRENNMAYLDWLFDFCDSKNIYVMLCLQHHGQVSTVTNPNWNENPYNAANGGMLTSPTQFWTNEAARAHTKNKYRYTVARWGYSSAIMTWELFNEVHWTDNLAGVYTQVAAWHDEMGKFIKQYDVYKRPVSTSFDGELADLTWKSDVMDYTQAHSYFNVSNIERALIGVNRHHIEKYKKPTLSGEYSIDVQNGSSANANDPTGIHVHNATWASLFGGGLGTGMTWWWDNYVEPKNLYTIYKPAAEAAKAISFNKLNLKPSSAIVSNAPGDVNIPTTNSTWGVKAQDVEGLIYQDQPPSNVPSLMFYLYSTKSNNQYRTPPRFETSSSTPFDFTIRTGPNISGTGANIQIFIDDKLTLEKVATINTNFIVKVPAGKHKIRVDNNGNDWITIASYNFAGLGSAIETYVLRSEDNKFLAGWLHNKNYTHITRNSPPPTVRNSKLIIDNLPNGSYQVAFHDCIKFESLSSEIIQVTNGTLSASVPEIAWDATFKVTHSDLVGAKELDFISPLELTLYPNPLASGGNLHIMLNSAIIEHEARINIYNSEGKIMSEKIKQIENHTLDVDTNNLPHGLYLLDIKVGKNKTIKPFIIH
jgi:hypothetical protein